MKVKKMFLEGIITNNPIFVMVLGMCSVIAMSNTLMNSILLGLATMVILILSNIFISLLGKMIPNKVRIPCYIIIISTLVTLVDMPLRAYIPGLYAEIGRFIQLIAVNCIIFARAEVFAASNKIRWSALDGLTMGLGFFIAIVLLGFLREIIGAGTILGYKIIPSFEGIGVFQLAAGGFIMLGLLMALFNYVYDKVKTRNEHKSKELKVEKALEG